MLTKHAIDRIGEGDVSRSWFAFMAQGTRNRQPKGLRYRGWESISDLAIHGSFPTREPPGIFMAFRRVRFDLRSVLRVADQQPPLQSCDHLDGEFRAEFGHRARLVGRCGVMHSICIYAQFGPCTLGTCWSEVSTAVLLRATNDRGRYVMGLFCPFLGALPPPCCHQWKQSFTDCLRLTCRFRPVEVLEVVFSHRDQYEPGAKLWHTVVRSLDQPPLACVPELPKSVQDVLTVAGEARHAETSNIFEQQSTRFQNIDLLDRPGEEVPLIIGPELLARNRERGARDASGEKVDRSTTGSGLGRVRLRIEYIQAGDIALRNLPMRTVELERRDGSGVQFHGKFVFEARQLESQSLPACAGADLDDAELTHQQAFPECWTG